MHNRGHKEHAIIKAKDGDSIIGAWFDARMWIGFPFKVKDPGTFDVEATVASPNG